MKKKMVTICLVVALVLTAVAGGSLAYFTDKDNQTNTFTAGNVDINLDEATVEADENDDLVVVTGRTEDAQTYELHPGQIVTKDPTITVAGTSNDAYVGAIITIKGDLYDLIGLEGTDLLDIHALASGGLLDNKANDSFGTYNGLDVFQNDDYAVHQVKSGENEWTLYVFMKNVQTADASIVLFDTLTIPAEWDNAEMAKVNNMSIEVKAFATQTKGFDNCYEALTTAFAADGFAF